MAAAAVVVVVTPNLSLRGVKVVPWRERLRMGFWERVFRGIRMCLDWREAVG